MQSSLYSSFIKRTLDIVLSAAALIMLSPVILVTALIIRIKLGKPVIFCQMRPGKHEQIFKLYKFRSMLDARDGNGNLLPDDIRLTSFGKKLRATSLDELPELFNILKGDMSIVGPRPLLVQYLPLYSEKQRHRHDVRPGLTGLAQIKGRNAVDWEERFRWDIEYVNNVTFMQDIRIIFETIRMVVKKEGIQGENSSTMQPFEGEKK